MKQIAITIDPMGGFKEEAIGFNGVGCAEATAALESALSGTGAKLERAFKQEWIQGENIEENIAETVEETLSGY